MQVAEFMRDVGEGVFLHQARSLGKKRQKIVHTRYRSSDVAPMRTGAQKLPGAQKLHLCVNLKHNLKRYHDIHTGVDWCRFLTRVKIVVELYTTNHVQIPKKKHANSYLG